MRDEVKVTVGVSVAGGVTVGVGLQDGVISDADRDITSDKVTVRHRGNG